MTGPRTNSGKRSPFDHPFFSDPLSIRDDADMPPMLDGNVDAAGRRTGTWKLRWADGGILAEVPYEDGRVHGVVRLIEPDGTEAQTQEWREGRRHGVTRAMEEDGYWHEIPFRDGKLHGTMTTFAEGGSVVETRPFEDDLVHGVVSARNPESGAESRESWEHGLPHGVWEFRDPAGDRVMSQEFFHGVLHGRSHSPIAGDEEYVHGIRVSGRLTWTEGDALASRPSFARLAVASAVLGAALWWAPGATATVLALGTGIAVHEVGHLLAARRAGIPIAVLRVGFGPSIVSFIAGSTLVDVRAIPLFGYVMPASVRPSAMPAIRARWRGETPNDADVDPGETPGPASELVSPGPRIVFALGGVTVNVLLAWLVRWLAFTPLAPHTAAAWVGERAVRLLTAVPDMIVSLVMPSTYTSGGGGLIAAGQEHVTGLGEALHMLVFVNLILAAFNVFPIPPLDGYRVMIAAIERAFGRSVAEQVARPLAVVGRVFFAVLVLAGLWFIGRDVLGVMFG